MRARWFFAFSIVMLLGADKKDEAIEKEMKALQGDWNMVAAEFAGKQQPSGKDKEVITIKDNMLVMTTNGKENMKATFKIDPTAKPKSMDWATKRGDKPIDIPLIYSLEGDDLKIVMPLVQAGKGETPKRPETFDTKDKPLMLMTLKRAKK